MKTPAATKVTTSAPNNAHFIGRLPKRQNTVIAEILRRLLDGEHVTSITGVFEASTTRLGAVVFSLRKCHGWQCEKQDKAAGCKDGRIAWIAEYRLSPLQRAAAVQCPDVSQWCRQVREARAKRRTQAAQAAHRAALLNQARAMQADLFAGGAQ
ncbi:MAG: hypothetical protein OZ923_03190 [Comamonadaceae bacterium]|nr:hypothetical protein [Burkholderiales bacterium]MEB2347594.1 hypothetical protein [Comamonadaceae bacterium]